MTKIQEEYLQRGLGPKPLLGEPKMVEIYARTWIPSGEILATVMFIHGLGEHCTRYDDLFTRFAEQGIKVGSFDQRGFGKTVKKNGSKGVNDFETMMKDIQFISDRTRIEGKPHFVMGHSMGNLSFYAGGGLCLQFASRQEVGSITGVIASAPMIRPGSFTAPIAVEQWAMKNLGGREFMRNVVLPTKIDINNISRDPEMMKLYKEDKFNHGWGSLVLLTEIFQKGGELLDVHVKSFNHPLLITHGSLDTLTCPNASKEFVDKAPATDKTHVIYDKYVHELHNEPLEDREKVYQQYISWITARV